MLDVLTAAHLCRFSYENNNADLRGLKCIEDHFLESIRFLYIQHPSSDSHFLVIRGTENPSNFKDDIAMLADDSVLARLGAATAEALAHFEGRYGACAGATGHSLGGKLLECLPERIRSISFNAYYNKHRANIYDVRVYGDIALLTGIAGASNTDHWVGSPMYATCLDVARGKALHSIDTVIDELHTNPCVSTLKFITTGGLSTFFAPAKEIIKDAIRHPAETAAKAAEVHLAVATGGLSLLFRR